MIDASTVKGNQARMLRLRSHYETPWAEIARLVYPEMNHFYGGAMANWSRTNPYAPAEMHDPYAAQALEDGVAVFEAFVMPRGQRWQKLALAPELMRSTANLQWVEKIEQRLFAIRHDPDSGFTSAVHEGAMSLFSFSGQSMWIEPRYSKVTGKPLGLTYQSEFVGEIFVEFDSAGRPMRMHRQFGLTAEQALVQFGRDAPAAVREAMSGPNAERNREREFTFLHIIEPNTKFDPTRLDAMGMPWAAAYYCDDGEGELFREGGHRSLPRIFSTFTRGVRNGWGYSPTMRVLPQIRLLQEITKARVYGSELRLLPPLLVADDELDASVIDMSPLGITKGGLDDRGNQMIREFLTNADSSDAVMLAQEARAMIDKAYGRDLLQLNRELKTHITATRTQEEMGEKGALLAPLARQESEWLSPMTQRELVLMLEMGLMDDMPGDVAEYLADGGGFDWRYDNQLSRMIKSQDSAAYLSLAEQVSVLAQFDNTVIDDFRREYPMDKVLQVLGENAGVPAAMRATDKERKAFDEKKAQAEQQQMLLETAPVLADAARNASAAGQMSLAG